jgi:hypothetical protein
MTARELLDNCVNLLNSCIDYLHKNTRFKLSSYSSTLHEEQLVEIATIMHDTRYEPSIDLMMLHSKLVRYVLNDYIFTHDDIKVSVKLPKCTVDGIFRYIANYDTLRKTREYLLALYIRDICPTPDDIINIIRYPHAALINGLSKTYKRLYTQHIYYAFDKSNVIWSDDECRLVFESD